MIYGNHALRRQHCAQRIKQAWLDILNLSKQCFQARESWLLAAAEEIPPPIDQMSPKIFYKLIFSPCGCNV